MSNKEKIRSLESDLKQATDLINHMSALIVPATQALKYIAGTDEESTSILLLNSAGIPTPGGSDRMAPKDVAIECLDLLKQIQNGFSVEPVSNGSGPEDVQLKDGEEIEFNTTFDILYHQCCDCGLVHEVGLQWGNLCDVQHNIKGVDCSPVLTTKWTRIDEMPTRDDLQRDGHEVVDRKA